MRLTSNERNHALQNPAPCVGSVPRVCGAVGCQVGVCLLGEADLQVGSEVLSGGEGVFPHHHVGYVVDGEAELRQCCVELIQAGRQRTRLHDSNCFTITII